MKLLAYLLRSSWRMVAIAVVTGCLSGGSSAGAIALVSYVLSGKATDMAALAVGFGVLAAIALTSGVVARVMLVRLSQTAVFHLQLRLSRQILASELQHLEQLGAARLLATLTEDVQTLSIATYNIPFLFIDTAIVAGGLLYVAWLSWRVFLMVALLAAIAVGSTGVLLKQARKLLARAREEQNYLFQHFRAINDGIKELKLHYLRRQQFLSEDLQGTANRFRQYNTHGLSLFAATDSLGKLIFFFAIGWMLFVLPRFGIVDPQLLAGYVLTFTFLVGPMENIVSKMPLLSRAGVALDNIEALGLSLTSRAEVMAAPAPTTPWHCLELKGVTHIYQSDREDTHFTLGPIDLTLHPGELVFVIGGNGSGKSTLAKLITGLYVPDSGEILLDGQPIDGQNREWYRQHFATVFSDFYLFDRFLGCDRPDIDSRVREYLKQLHLDRKVTVEDGKLSTIALSQGQRKRVALIAAYLEERSLYLFDEWAADQDPTFKELFYTQLLPDLRDSGKAVVVISHDDRYFHLGDRLIALDFGKIAYDKALTTRKGVETSKDVET